MAVKTNDPAGMGWAQCTGEGSETAQLRVWMKLSLREKLLAVESMADLSRRMMELCQRDGRPYFDPQTGDVVTTPFPPKPTPSTATTSVASACFSGSNSTIP
jgi:hypothetical protein